MILQPGFIFGEKYEIVALLSSGAQAAVYKAIQKPLERPVILKVLSPALVSNSEMVARFEREAKLLSSLNDDGIVKVYDFNNVNGVYFFVTEYIAGKSIKELLDEKKRLAVPLAAYIIVEASRILARLHSQGIIHRDIKPANIILSNDGKIKLTDFGLAFSQALPSLTIEGSILGTPAYMSPEQILGKSIDNRTDIYSLGVVFYELITGINPFLANSFSAILHKVLTVKPIPFYKLDPPLKDTEDLWHLVKKMLNKNKEERISDITDVLNELEIWFEQNAIDRSAINKFLFENQEMMDTKTIPVKKKIKSLIIIPIMLLVVVAIIIGNSVYNKVRIKSSNQNIINKEIHNNHLSNIKVESITSLPQKNVLVNEPSEKEQIPRQQGNAKLRVNVVPWATVYLDNQEIFTTPKDTELIVDVGKHILKIVNPNFPPVESLLSVMPDQNMQITIDLTARVGYLQISVSPWADVYIDDIYKATTPIAQPLMISVGRKRLTLKNPYYAPYHETIYFNSKETVERNIILK